MQLDTQSLAEFFRERFEEVQKKRNVMLLEDTQFYVVNLLSEFLESKKLLTSAGSNEIEEPIALIFARAVEASYHEQFRLMKTIGDRTLYVSGFFGDSLKQRVVDIDYYIMMGEQAYSFVSGLSRGGRQGQLFSGVFGELSEKFKRLVDLLSEISESTELTSDRDLLRLYERWLATKSERLSAKLRQQGIMPVECDKEPIH